MRHGPCGQYGITQKKQTARKKLLEDLLDKLKNGSAPVRYTAANKLGKLGVKDAIDHLIDALDDEDEMVRDNVIFALGELEGTKAVPRLVRTLKSDKSPRVRKSAAKSLGMIKAVPAVGALVAALADPDFKVRKSAARALGRIGDKSAVPALTTALQDPDYTVVKYVEDAIERLTGL